MSQTFSQIYIHVIFAVKYRNSLILHDWEDELYKYITGIVTNKNQKMISINGMPDHIHLFLGLKPSCCLSNLVREIKKSSTKFIKRRKFCKCKFQWQEGFGSFSHSHSNISSVANYIKNQKAHHKKKTFRDEYLDCLIKNSIEYKKEYLFDFFEHLP